MMDMTLHITTLVVSLWHRSGGVWVAEIDHYLRVTKLDSPSSQDELRLAVIKFYKRQRGVAGMHKVVTSEVAYKKYAIDISIIGAKLVQFGRYGKEVGGDTSERKVWYCKTYPNVSRMQ
jgi:hypothetical protein